MLLRFEVGNFRSILAPQAVSLVASSLKDLPGGVIKHRATPFGILKVAAIYGANASGKTNFLTALTYLGSAISNSQTRWKPESQINRHPFALSESAQSEATSFCVDFVLNEVRHQFGLELSNERVEKEWLFSYPSRRKQKLYERHGENFKFGRALSGENRQIQKLTRPNSIFLSAAAQNNHEALTPIYEWFARDWSYVTGDLDPHHPRSISLCKNENFKSRVEKLLCSADLGLMGFSIAEAPFPEDAVRVFEAVKATLPADESARLSIPEMRPTITFQHRGERDSLVELPLSEESAGTIALLALLPPAMDVLSRGTVLVVDELESKLHPLMSKMLVRLFNSGKSNRRGAQLIFATHSTHLLDPEILRRDQVWFAEKSIDGQTTLFPATDFRLRRNQNLRTGYLQGRFGAVPVLPTHSENLVDD